MSNILAIEPIDGGWQYTLDTPPANGWDIWLASNRLETQYTDTTYKLFRLETRPPAIEVVDPYDFFTNGKASAYTRIQWQHYGARFYIVESSGDGIDFNRMGIVPGDGNIWHTFGIQAVNGTTYWRVYAADQDARGYYPTSYPLPCVVEQAYLPVPPWVKISVANGNAIINPMLGISSDGVIFDVDSVPVSYGGGLA